MSMPGSFQIVFDDESVLYYTVPDLRVDKLLIGKRTARFYKTFTVNYETHGLIAEVTMNPQPKKFLGFIGKKSKFPSDYLSIEFYGVDGDRKGKIGSGNGSWLGSLEMDGEQVWDVFDPKDEWQYVSELPSDSLYRPDLIKLRRGDIDGAQSEKDTLEKQQRADKALRDKGKKIRLNSKK